MAYDEQNKAVLERIRKLSGEYEQNTVEIIPDVSFSQKETLIRIEKYYAGKFLLGGERDAEGFHKFFFNLSPSRCDVATKAIDLDTKDLRIQAENRIKGWLMSKELKMWARLNGIGRILNQIVSSLPVYGTVVIKSVQGKLTIVNLRNLINDPTVESLKDSDIIEKHEYTPDELSRQPWNKDAIAEVIKLHVQTKDPYIIVYEARLWVPEGDVVEGGDPDKFVRYLCIAAGLDLPLSRPLNTNRKDEKKFVKLYAELDPEHPYREVHWERVPGRWLGRGIVEKLFDVQERVNEIVNRLAKVEHWASKQVFQSRDVILQKNLLTDAYDGDIIKVQSEITKIGVEDRNAPNMRTDLQLWIAQADKLAFSFEIATGENLPSGTPFRLAFIQQQAVASYFDIKREEIGLFLREIIIELVIPEFKKDKKKLHKMIVDGADEDMSLLRAAVSDALIRQQMSMVLESVKTFEDLQQLLLSVQQRIGTKVSLEIPDSFYKDVEESVDIIITGEQMDSSAKITTLTTALQALGANPGILQNPILRRIFGRALDAAGEDSSELLAGAELVPPTPAPVAGSVAKQQPNDVLKAVQSSKI